MFLIGLLAVVGGFLLLIAPHEAGHLAGAKLFRMRVHEYSVGFGTKLWSITRGGTVYALRAFPLGGYVRIGGMEPGEYDLPDGFHRKPAYQRLIVLLAGPFANFVLAIILVAIVLVPGSATEPGTVALVEPGTPAATAGIRAGDVVVGVNGHPIQSSGDIRAYEAAAPGKPLDLAVRDQSGTVRHVVITPRKDPAQNAYLIGIRSRPTVTESLVTSVTFPYQTAAGIVGGIYQLAVGQIPGGLLGPQGATGPIGIAAITYQSVQGGWMTWVELLALLSVALGLTNLLPLPALDGGRIVVVLAEKVRGKPFDREREMTIQRFGLAALMALVLVISYFDIQRIASHQFPFK